VDREGAAGDDSLREVCVPGRTAFAAHGDPQEVLRE